MFSTIGYAICIPFAALLRLFYNLTGSYGVSLILFTLVIKLILLPFQMKSKKSMVRMSRMSGKMQEIQKKYANNQMKMQEEMQKFYQEEGFSPMSGCLWSFLPLPILMALYYIIRDPIVYFMNFGGKEAGLEVVEAARQLIEGAGIQIQASTGYEQIAIAMRRQLERTPRGHKLLVPDDMPTDRAINHLQFFIMKHRGEVRDVDSDRPMTFHGLRHTYAAEKYQELVDSGKSPLDAHFEVSRLLGHERPDVTNIYLASLPKGERHGK